MEAVETVRRFNRFYTNLIGVLRGGLLDTPYSLTEARVLYELAHGEVHEVVDLRQALDIDAGYLSRILRRLVADGLADSERSTVDGRRQRIRLTESGHKVFADLDARSTTQIEGLLERLDGPARRRLVGAMATIEDLLGDARRPATVVLRPLEPGDLGWVVQRHGALYAEQYGWDQSFEVLVARIVADYGAAHDPAREGAWIAEVDGAPVGCIFCVRKDDTTAQLRLLLVEPSARGAGVGSRLVEECVRFARRSGYREIVLWTNDVLVEARRIYERAGFRLVSANPHHAFGKDLVEQDWRLSLPSATQGSPARDG
jgi:DNA-binding MarR family transcriptional regulator/GNAT superfamily N-acetyltransferase